MTQVTFVKVFLVILGTLLVTSLIIAAAMVLTGGYRVPALLSGIVGPMGADHPGF